MTSTVTVLAGAGACENLTETASMCATECTWHLVVSCVGREHLRSLETCITFELTGGTSSVATRTDVVRRPVQ